MTAPRLSTQGAASPLHPARAMHLRAYIALIDRALEGGPEDAQRLMHQLWYADLAKSRTQAGRLGRIELLNIAAEATDHTPRALLTAWRTAAADRIARGV